MALLHGIWSQWEFSKLIKYIKQYFEIICPMIFFSWYFLEMFVVYWKIRYLVTLRILRVFMYLYVLCFYRKKNNHIQRKSQIADHFLYIYIFSIYFWDNPTEYFTFIMTIWEYVYTRINEKHMSDKKNNCLFDTIRFLIWKSVHLFHNIIMEIQ